MAITFIQQPKKYTPSDNPILFQLTSNNSNIVSFYVTVYNATNSVIGTYNYFVTPDNLQGTYLNLSGLLSSFVEKQIENTTAVIKGVSGATFQYRIKVVEKINSNGNIVDGATYDNTNDKYYVFSAKLNNYDFRTYNYRDYLNNSITNNQFLTEEPNYGSVNYWSSEFLYFLSDTTSPAKNLRIKTFNKNGVQVSVVTTTVAGITGNTMNRLNISPKNLAGALNINFSGVTNYTVELINSSGGTCSEIKTYNCFDVNCKNDLVNLIWTNNLGGVDSFTFINATEKVSVTKSSIKVNPYQYDEDGIYDDTTYGIVNPDQKIINVNQKSSYNVTTEPLNESIYRWLLTSLLASEKVYVELSDGTYIPINITTKQADIKRRKYNKGELIRLPIDFEAESNLTLNETEVNMFGNPSLYGIQYVTPFYIPSTNFYTTLIGDGSASYYTVTHNLNSVILDVTLIDTSTSQVVYADVSYNTNNTISIDFASPVPLNRIRVNIDRLN